MPELARAPAYSEEVVAGHRFYAVQSGIAAIELPVPDSFSPLSEQEFVVASLLSIGKTLNQIRGSTAVELSRGEAVQIEESAQAKLGVKTPSALVHQLIGRGILPIVVNKDWDLIRGLPASDRYALRSYAQGVPVERIADTLGMTVPKFIKYEPVLLRKVGARKRPQAVRYSHELGIID